MKKIKEAEELTGISAENIRYYEKQNLICPSRNCSNSYREYSDDDIVRLKMIRLFRSLNMPIGEIRRLFDGQIALEEALFLQEKRLESEKEKLNEAIRFCREIHESQLADLDVDTCLRKMNDIAQKEKSAFHRFVEDYKDIVVSEMKRDFSFMPYSRCKTAAEFTEDLLKFADENGENIVIIQEGMNPRFMMDGIEYKAYRTSGRYGIVVHCEMVHPEDYIPAGMSEKKYRRYRILSIIALPVLVFLAANMWLFLKIDWMSLEGLVCFLVIVAVGGADLMCLFYCYGKNFKG